MANVHKLGAVKYFIVTLTLHICTDEATHPIIGDDDGREDFELAKGLKSDQSIEDQLFCNIECPLAIVWLRE